MSRCRCVFAVALLLLCSSMRAADVHGVRLADIRARGALTCGIWPQVRGFAMRRDGTYVGFDIDTCRAVAAAIFGDASKIRFVELAHIEQLQQRSDIDLVVRRLTRTREREVATGMVFGPVTFHDGQGFLVPRNSGIERISQLAAGPICVINAERHPKILFEFLRENDSNREIVLVQSDEEAEQALRGGRCAAYSADISWLAAARAGFANGQQRYDILPDLISREPLAPLMRPDDAEFVEVVRRTISTLLEAEELGIDSSNVMSSFNHRSQAGSWTTEPQGSIPIGHMRPIISSVGNYGEMYERNLGAGSGLNLERGLNRLRSDGGLLAP